MTPTLRTQGLSKQWGEFKANSDISLSFAPGARHALIGPNGAGKTTFINLLTGALPATSGAVFLGDDDISSLQQHQRVKRGMTRTFQINTLFPGLTVLESVVLAICEREGRASVWRKTVAQQREAVDEAVALLERLRLSAERNELTKNLAYGKQRLVEIALALATRPSILLLDEPAAGIPAGESSELFEVIAALPRDVTIVFIEHDMDLVFRFAERITVMVAGKVLTEGPPSEIQTDPRVKEVYLGEARSMAELIALDNVSAGYGESVVLDGVSLSLNEGDSLALLGRNGVGKTTTLITMMGLTRLHKGTLRWKGGDFRAVPTHERAHAGIGWVPQERYMWPSLTIEEHLTAVSRPGPWTVERIYGIFPRLQERRKNLGNQLSGGEQQMLAIARALMVNPSLLLLDEPMEGLAPIIVQELMVVIGKLVSETGMAVIVVEQHAKLALSLTKSAIVLDRGRVVHRSDSASLSRDPDKLQRLVAVS